jgi:hypothetical protein
MGKIVTGVFAAGNYYPHGMTVPGGKKRKNAGRERGRARFFAQSLRRPADSGKMSRSWHSYCYILKGCYFMVKKGDSPYPKRYQRSIIM